MRFMEKKVDEGNLGVLKNTFLFIHKPLQQAADDFDKAIERMPLQNTTAIGTKPDPTYVHISGTEPSSTSIQVSFAAFLNRDTPMKAGKSRKGLSW
jgi:hypothetical protein